MPRGLKSLLRNALPAHPFGPPSKEELVMDDRNEIPEISSAWNASLLALVIFLAVMLYVFGTAMSGDTDELTASIRGADVVQSR
jgi:hypothetical protein